MIQETKSSVKVSELLCARKKRCIRIKEDIPGLLQNKWLVRHSLGKNTLKQALDAFVFSYCVYDCFVCMFMIPMDCRIDTYNF